jgi:hypothetical protein
MPPPPPPNGAPASSPGDPADNANNAQEASVVAAASGMPARAKSLFMRAEVAESAGELREALKLYDQGVREATSSLRGSSGDTGTSTQIAAVDGYFRRAMVLKARIRDGDAQRQAAQKPASERQRSPGRGGARRRQGPEAAATGAPEGVPAERSAASAAELQAEREETSRLRDELAAVSGRLAEANGDLADANDRLQRQAAMQRAPPDTPDTARSASPARSPADTVDGGTPGGGYGPTLEHYEMRLNTSVSVEESALASLTDDAQELVDATPGEQGLFMQLECAGWVVCRTSQGGAWERRWLAVRGEVATLWTSEAAPKISGGGDHRVEDGGDNVAEQASSSSSASRVATASLRGCTATPLGTDRLRLVLLSDDSGGGGGGGGGGGEWTFSPAAATAAAGDPSSSSSLAVADQRAVWVVVLEAGARYCAGVAAHRDLRRAQAVDMTRQAGELLSRGDALGASVGFRQSAQAILELDGIEVAEMRPDVSDAMAAAERGMDLAEGAMASEAARTDAAITAAVAPFTEQLAVMATDIASESAAEAVKEATARVEQWKARAKRVEADLAASADAVADLELAALEAKQQQAASKGSRGGTAPTQRQHQVRKQSGGGGCCGGKPN